MPSGRPDWFGTIVAAGKYDTTYIPIALDVDGFITATMKGKYDTDALLKTIAVDSAGVMKANISVQDLDYMTVRPGYGGADGYGAPITVPTAMLTTLKTVTGRGVIYPSYVRWTAAASRRAVETHLYVDGVSLFVHTAEHLYTRQVFAPGRLPLYVIEYDDDNFSYAVGIQSGITFESELSIKAYHSYGADQDVDIGLTYALVP